MGVLHVRDSLSRTKEFNHYKDDGTSQTINAYANLSSTESLNVEDGLDISVLFNLSKAKEDQGLVSGWASVSTNPDGSIPLDWQDDIIPIETLEKAAIGFMLEYRQSGEMHKGDSKGTIVESIVLTKEKQEAMGIPEGSVPEGWFVTVKIEDKDVMKKVKEGKYRMFSIQGRAKRVKL